MTEALRIVAATLVGTLATAVVAGVPLSLASQWGDASRSVPDLAVGVLLAVAVSWLGGLWYIALPSAFGWYVTWRFAFDGVRDPLRRHVFAAWAGATFAIALNALQGRPPGSELLVVAPVAFVAATLSVLAWRALFSGAGRRER